MTEQTSNATSDSSRPYHIPALLPQVIEGLDIQPGGVYVDVTFGGGGHSRAILDKLNDRGRLYAFDQDLDAVAGAIADERFIMVHSNFRYLSNFMAFHGVGSIDGLLADLGVSFHHFDVPERGFSFRWEESPLDMRMNGKGSRTAAMLLNETDEAELTRILKLYGELKNASKIAKSIIDARNKRPFETVSDLMTAISPYLNPAHEKKDMACVFQALRIAVNNELAALSCLLESSAALIKPGGRIAIITYHSLEDRLVKNFFRTGNLEGDMQKDFFGKTSAPFKPLNSKPIVPDASEVERNPRSRSAKLRIAIRR